MKKTDFLQKYSLNIRDLRPVFSPLQVSTILPRDDSVIINLGFIKNILSSAEAYFLVQGKNEKIKKLVENISKHIKKESPDVFYLFILEKIFEAKVEQMSQKVRNIKKELEPLLHHAREQFREENLKALLFNKKRITKLESRLGEIESAINEVLEKEENFNELISIEEEKLKIDAAEAESILENFLEQIEDIKGNILRLKDDLENTQEFLDLKMSLSLIHI